MWKCTSCSTFRASRPGSPTAAVLAALILGFALAPFTAHAGESGDRLAFFGWAPGNTKSTAASRNDSAVVLPFRPHRHAYAKRMALQLSHEGRVTAALDAPGFNTTYLELEKNGDRFWIASRISDIQVGSTVAFSPENVVTMENFQSKALSKTFSRIYFVPSLTVID